MKQTYFFRAFVVFALFLFPAVGVFAQPVGANIGNPLNAGTLSPGIPFSDTRNNNPANGYGNDMGQPSDDIYYKFTLNGSVEVSLSHCSSAFDTYMHLLDINGNIIVSNDDNGPLCSTTQSSIKIQLSAGTYYVVSEGYSTNSGDITTEISIPAIEGDTPDDFSTRVRYIFQYVDKTPVNTGILLDCGLEFLNMENYTGTALHDSNYVSINDWRSIYGSLLSSQFNGQISFTDFPTINAAVDAATGTTVPFVSLHYNYQVLRPDAVSSGLMYSSNDQLYDVVGRPYSPYLTKTAFAIAPAKDHVVAPNGWVTYNFPANLIYGNTGKTLSLLKIDVGDGAGLRTIQQGQAFNIQYSSGGYKNLTYQVTYTDNSVNTGQSRIYVEWQQDYYSPGGHESMFFHTGTGGTVQINTAQGIKQAFLQVRLSDQRTGSIIRKPFIVVEGIDFWRIASPNNPRYNTDVTDFIDISLINGQLFPNGNLRDAIDLDGYDIIYIDFEDGVDALENNSALVRAAITWVNGQKQALDGVMQQNVVLGISMGGVLARHALRTMEVNNIPHDTRLYISMDSPHQGANFPVSLQAMVKHLNRAEFSLFWGALPLFKFKDAFPGIELAKQILDAPATKQLLTYRIGDGGSLPIDNFSHDSFYSNYRNLGYPALSRNIAISNGSECGTPQAYGPLATIFKQEERFKIPYLIDAISSSVQIYGVFTNRPLIGLYAPLAFLSTKSSFVIFFEAKALPDKSSQQIYKGQLGISRKVLGFINVSANITNKSVNSTSSMLPLDNAPGGVRNFPAVQDSVSLQTLAV